MKRLILTAAWIVGFQTCFSQFDNNVHGMYITEDIGMWKRVLVLKPDSTFFFCVDTDQGGQDFIEPNDITLTTWSFNRTSLEIVLNPTKDYKPKINIFHWDTLGLSSGSKKKLKTWTKIADMDSLGNISTFQHGSDLIKFTGNYQPLFSEWYYPREKRKTKTTYYKLSEQELSLFREKYFKLSADKDDMYSEVRLIKSMIELFFPVEIKEEFTETGHEIKYFDKSGNEKQQD